MENIKKSAKSDTYRHGNLAEACMAAGLSIIKSEGVQALSLRKVARLTGVSSAAPYKHFPNKEALLIAIATRGFETFESFLLRDQPATDLDFNLDYFLIMSRNYLKFAVDNPYYYQLMFSHPLAELHLSEDFSLTSSRTFQILVDSVVVLQRKSAMMEGEPYRLALSIWSSLHGLASLHLSSRLNISADSEFTFADMIDFHLEVMLKGFSCNH